MTQLNITPKQMEVLHYLSYGLQNKQIARKMGVTVATVKLHLLGLYQRLDVNSRMCALLKAQPTRLDRRSARVGNRTAGRRKRRRFT